MTRFARMSLLILPALLLLPVNSEAQSAQSFSFQVSALASAPFGGGLAAVSAGGGWEGQFRWNPGALSIGAGIEQTFHDVDGFPDRTVRLTGGFLEPRYVIDTGSDRAVPYLAARLASSEIFVEEGTNSSTATGFTVNGGGGLLVRLGSSTNLDFGVSVGWKDLGEATIGNTVFDMGTGSNLIFRLGLAFGFGG